ncbi:MAG TPA: TetR family transcriptional regulator [Solirubrobacteraceae bacterium]|nr:TetR family transcriptional regulator [Solirubrobacteraceae bacterium]
MTETALSRAASSDTVAPVSSAPESTTPYRVAARRLLRDSLFSAARRLLTDRPWAQITMSEVARAAGVSRQTLYKEFGSRDEFAQQFVIREGARFLDEVEHAILANIDDPRAAVAAGLEVFLTAASEDPLVKLLLDDDGTGGMLPLITTQSRPVLDWASARLCEAMRSGCPDVRDEDAELLADSFVRLAISYVTMPRQSPRETAAEVADLLAPYMERAMATAVAAT